MRYSAEEKLSVLKKDGDEITRPCMIAQIKNIDEGLPNKPKTLVTLSDGERIHSIKVFDSKEDVENKIQENNVYSIRFYGKESKGTVYVNMDLKKRPEKVENISKTEFAIVVSSEGEKLYDEILNMVKEANVQSDGHSLVDLTVALYQEKKDKLVQWTAAKSNHHVGFGGLMLHTNKMVHMAKCYADIYPDLDRELLICGAALHDIGKLEEYDMDGVGNATITPTYVLLGHLLTGAMQVNEKAKEIGCDSMRATLLEHMIASHHNRAEYGAIKGAAIPEAIVLSHIDDADAKINTFQNMYAALSTEENRISVSTLKSDYDNFAFKA